MQPACFPVVDLTGLRRGRARGERYGAAAAANVAVSLATYRWALPELTGQPWAELARQAAGHLGPTARALGTEVVDELEGIARGAGVPFDDIAVLNARSELLAGRAIVGECTAVADGAGLGQTWDWYVRQRDAAVVVQADGYVTFTEGGMPAKIGCNRHGIGVTLNFLTTTAVPSEPGVPVHLLLHAVLERATNLAEAEDLLLSTPAACSAAVVVADAAGDAVAVELAPNGCTAVVERGRTLAHANHCLGTGAGHDLPRPTLEDSHRRHRRAMQLLLGGVPIDQILADTTIDVPEVQLVGTVAAVVMDLSARRMSVAPGRPSETGFVQHLSL